MTDIARRGLQSIFYNNFENVHFLIARPKAGCSALKYQDDYPIEVGGHIDIPRNEVKIKL